MMATYFQEGPEIQENMQTLYLMNPNYSYINIPPYSDTHNSHPQSNMLLLNALAQGNIPHAPPPHQPPGQPFIAIPLSDNPGRPSSSSGNHDRHGLAVSQGLSLSLSRNPGVGAARGGILGSKYLTATQELLDEVVSVGYQKGDGAYKGKGKEAVGVREGGEGGGRSKEAVVVAEQLSPPQRQELQMKKAKLLNMLDEVEQRYRQYHSQMQAVVSSFEQEAGIDSAKSYTCLPLKTISRQFRCLKDTISSLIKATNKSLGEDDHEDGGNPDGRIGSRLRFVDHQLRQQKALQQLGMNMMPNNAWRPQRGLPERAVSLLRAWLFEHFLHPYPKDSDKHMLAKQTGLTRSQVSNWFINARVRLWKPMVEEMYVEEMKAQGHDTDNSDNNNNNNTNNVSPSEKDRNQDHQPTSKPTAVAQQHEQQQQHYRGVKPGTMPNPQTTNGMISSDMGSLIGPTRNAKKQRAGINNSDIHSSPSSILSTDMDTKPLDNQTQEGPGGSGFNAVYFANDIPGRFNQLDHLTRPYRNNGVSLTLGLPHCDNLSGHHQQEFLPNQGMQLGRRLEVGAQEADFWGISMGQPGSDNGYESIDIQSHKRFAAHQLLHDFVA